MARGFGYLVAIMDPVLARGPGVSAQQQDDDGFLRPISTDGFRLVVSRRRHVVEFCFSAGPSINAKTQIKMTLATGTNPSSESAGGSPVRFTILQSGTPTSASANKTISPRM